MNDRAASGDGAVIFDLFGTLVAWPKWASAAVPRTLGMEPEAFFPLWSKTRPDREKGLLDYEGSMRQICREIGVVVDDERFAAARAAYLDLLRGILVPRPGAIETLTTLRESGRRLGLLSDAAPDVRVLWQSTPLARLFDAVVFSCEVGATKPDARMYRLICDRLGVAAERCVYVGNGEHDELAGALRMGMRAILFSAPGEPQGEEASDWRSEKIERLEQVLDVLGVRAAS